MHYFEHVPDIQEILELAPSSKACLFDMDGTLLNTEILHAKSVFGLLKDPALSFQEVSDLCLGQADSFIFQALIERNHFSNMSVEELINLKKDKYLMCLEEAHATEIFLPAIEALLKALKKRGLKVALVTSSDEKSAKASMEKLGLLELFELVVTEESTEKNKPHPDPYFHASETLGLGSSECIVFEDSPAGLEAARAFNPAALVRVGWY